MAAEGGTRIRKRLAALKRHHSDMGSPLFALIRYPIDLRSSDANLKELIALIALAENEIGERCVWVVVDTLSRALAGGDENSPVDMGRIVTAADAIRDATSAHFSFVHHTGKDAARGARGHSLLRAATDTEIEVTTGAVSVTKQRDMESDFTLGFQLLDISIGEDPNGMPIRSAIVEWNGEATKPSKAGPSNRVPASQGCLPTSSLRRSTGPAKCVRPFHDGPLVRAVHDELVRERYYAAIAEPPTREDDPGKVAARKRRAFPPCREGQSSRAKRLTAKAEGGRRLLWRRQRTQAIGGA